MCVHSRLLYIQTYTHIHKQPLHTRLVDVLYKRTGMLNNTFIYINNIYMCIASSTNTQMRHHQLTDRSWLLFFSRAAVPFSCVWEIQLGETMDSTSVTETRWWFEAGTFSWKPNKNIWARKKEREREREKCFDLIHSHISLQFVSFFL